MKMKALLFFLPLFFLISPAFAVNICDFSVGGNLSYSNYSLQAIKINTSTYLFNNTETGEAFYLNLNCLFNKTFFVIVTEQEFNVTSKEEVNFSFIISPVKFTNYKVRSRGVLGEWETNISNLDEPYIYNVSKVVPLLPSSDYIQNFEILNDEEVQYLNFIFHVTSYPEPKILKVVYPQTLIFGRESEVALLTYNTSEVVVHLLLDDSVFSSFNLTKQEEDWFEGKIFTLENISKIRFEAKNAFTSTIIEKNVHVDKIDLSGVSNYIFYPAIRMNETKKILLVDFNVSKSILVDNISIQILPQQNYLTNFTYYVSNEDGEVYLRTLKAKSLYLYLFSLYPGVGKLNITISSPHFTTKSFIVEVIFSETSYAPKVTINYFGKETVCELKGENLLNSSYVCSFYLPYNYNPETFRDVELELMKDNYETRINGLKEDLEKTVMQRNIMLAVIIILIVSLILYIKKDTIKILIWRYAPGGV